MWVAGVIVMVLAYHTPLDYYHNPERKIIMNRRTITKLPLFAALAGVTGLAAAIWI